MKIVCISDIHMSDTFDEGLTAHEWMEDFLEVLAEQDDVDHLLIAGDVIGTRETPSKTVDFHNLRALLRYYGFYDSMRCTVIPGNHDVRKWGSVANDPKPFQKAFPQLHSKRGSRWHGYLHVKRLGPVSILGVDTATDMGRFANHSGAIGHEQLQALKTVLETERNKGQYVVCAMHHPPFAGLVNAVQGKLHDAEQFWELVDDSNVDLIVCGHEHASWDHEDAAVPVACVGGFMGGDGRSLLIDVDEHGLTYSWREWGEL